MAAIELSERLSALETTLGSIETVLDVPALKVQLAELEAEASVPNLWDDPAHAQVVTSKLSGLQSEVRKVESLSARMADLPVMFDLAEAEDDADALAEAEAELASLRQAVAAIATIWSSR